jgi:hypothetical protein
MESEEEDEQISSSTVEDSGLMLTVSTEVQQNRMELRMTVHLKNIEIVIIEKNYLGIVSGSQKLS